MFAPIRIPGAAGAVDCFVAVHGLNYGAFNALCKPENYRLSENSYRLSLNLFSIQKNAAFLSVFLNYRHQFLSRPLVRLIIVLQCFDAL